jgi:hypothetical protein
MKRLCISTLAILCLGVYQNTYAEIRNGYDNEIIKVEKWLEQLLEIANGVLNEAQQKKMKKKVKEAQAILDKLRKKQAITQVLIEKVRMIDPGLYDEVNTIQDCEGNETDVYIKAVDRLQPGKLGATNVNHSVENPNVYNSANGDHTVSVWVVNTTPTKAMLILVHELGHVRYQVPNLATYVKYYKKVYQQKHSNRNFLGHYDDDPSQKTVKKTMQAFMESWIVITRPSRGMAKNKSRKMMVSMRSDNRTEDQ